MRDSPDKSFWESKTVLVTGSSGFAGRNLCLLLSKLGANLRHFVRSRTDLPPDTPGDIVLGDVQDYQSLIEAVRGADLVFHLAAVTLIPETRAKTFNTFSTNAFGTLNLLMAARNQDVSKIVYVSTCHVYGRQNRLPITEDMTPRPIDIYSASKLAGESLALSFSEMYGMNISISRAFNHYGPHQRPDFLIPSIILKLLGRQKMTMGNPSPTRDFTFVKDIVEGYALLAEKGRSSEIYHFSSGEERSVRDIVDSIMKSCHVQTEVQWNPDGRKVDIPRSVGDSSKASHELGWAPSVSFEEGIKQTVAWYKSQSEMQSPEVVYVPNA